MSRWFGSFSPFSLRGLDIAVLRILVSFGCFAFVVVVPRAAIRICASNVHTVHTIYSSHDFFGSFSLPLFSLIRLSFDYLAFTSINKNVIQCVNACSGLVWFIFCFSYCCCCGRCIQFMQRVWIRRLGYWGSFSVSVCVGVGANDGWFECDVK